MSKRWRFNAALVVIALAALTIAPAVADEVTVGSFLQQMARLRSLNATDPEIAVDSLRASGLRIPEGLNYAHSLTEADVVRIAAAAGVRVSTSTPSARFDANRVERFLSTFHTELATNAPTDPAQSTRGEGNGEPTNGNGPPFDPFSKGKGKGKGEVSPSSPD